MNVRIVRWKWSPKHISWFKYRKAAYVNTRFVPARRGHAYTFELLKLFRYSVCIY